MNGGKTNGSGPDRRTREGGKKEEGRAGARAWGKVPRRKRGWDQMHKNGTLGTRIETRKRRNGERHARMKVPREKCRKAERQKGRKAQRQHEGRQAGTNSTNEGRQKGMKAER